MLRLNWRASLLWHLKQTASFPLPLLACLLPSAASVQLLVRQSFCRFDLQRLLRQRLHDLKGQESENVNHVVVRFAVDDGPEAGPLAEALALAEGEGCLPAVAPVDVLLLGHVLGAFVGGGEARERRFVLLLLFFVFFVVALGDLFGEEGVDFPGEDEFGFLGRAGFLRCRGVYATGGLTVMLVYR